MKKKKMRKISLLLGAVLFGMSICTPSESICLGATELEISLPEGCESIGNYAFNLCDSSIISMTKE